MAIGDGLREMKTAKFWQAVLAEFLGTAMLVLFACGACWGDKDDAGYARNSILAIAISFGLTVGGVVWTIAHCSGGHINPAVTLGFLVTRRISIFKTLLYIVAQCAGAVVGAILLKGLTKPGMNDKLGIAEPAQGVSDLGAMMFELLVTFLLVFTVFATCDGRRKGFAGSGPLTIGLSITIGHLWAIPFTGAGTNPARVFGPAVIASRWNAHWAYWVGPLIGGALAALLYDLLLAVNATRSKLRAFFTRMDYEDEQFDDQGRIPAARDEHDLDPMDPKRRRTP